MKSRRIRSAFTLIELLIVIAIIAILASMMLPILAKAKLKGHSIRCVSNLKQIGVALSLYLDENSGTYPVHNNWADVGGQTPANPYSKYAASTPAASRPLNAYAGKNGAVFSCPSDKGDSYELGVNNCFERYGNSYLVQWGGTYFGVQGVTAPPGSKPMQESEVGRRASTKIIMGDWIWHPNRDLNDPRTVWHNYKGQRRLNMLYGDGHVENSRLPATMDPYVPVNMNGPWW